MKKTIVDGDTSVESGSDHIGRRKRTRISMRKI